MPFGVFIDVVLFGQFDFLLNNLFCAVGSSFRQLCAAKVGRRYETTDAQKDQVTSRKH